MKNFEFVILPKNHKKIQQEFDNEIYLDLRGMTSEQWGGIPLPNRGNVVFSDIAYNKGDRVVLGRLEPLSSIRNIISNAKEQIKKPE